MTPVAFRRYIRNRICILGVHDFRSHTNHPHKIFKIMSGETRFEWKIDATAVMLTRHHLLQSTTILRSTRCRKGGVRTKDLPFPYILLPHTPTSSILHPTKHLILQNRVSSPPPLPKPPPPIRQTYKEGGGDFFLPNLAVLGSERPPYRRCEGGIFRPDRRLLQSTRLRVSVRSTLVRYFSCDSTYSLVSSNPPENMGPPLTTPLSRYVNMPSEVISEEGYDGKICGSGPFIKYGVVE